VLANKTNLQANPSIVEIATIPACAPILWFKPRRPEGVAGVAVPRRFEDHPDSDPGFLQVVRLGAKNGLVPSDEFSKFQSEETGPWGEIHA
jgi:hypothetical protein